MKKKTPSKAGRKKAEDPKIMVPVWVEQSVVSTVGGMEKAKIFAKEGLIMANNRIVTNKALGL